MKVGTNVILKWLLEIRIMVWRTSMAPKDWWSATIALIQRKAARRVQELGKQLAETFWVYNLQR